MPYLVFALDNEILNSHRAGHTYSKHGLKVNSDIFSLDFAVPSLSKQENKDNQSKMPRINSIAAEATNVLNFIRYNVSNCSFKGKKSAYHLDLTHSCT